MLSGNNNHISFESIPVTHTAPSSALQALSGVLVHTVTYKSIPQELKKITLYSRSAVVIQSLIELRSGLNATVSYLIKIYYS